MSPSSWIKDALAKEANPSWIIKSEHSDQSFQVIDECVCVDFYTKPDEIAIIICDESGLQIFAICTRAQKLKMLSKENSTSETLEKLHLWCLEYKLEMRENVTESDTEASLHGSCAPGVDYQIVIILLEMEKRFAEEEAQIHDAWLRFWYCECNECTIFAKTIFENQRTLVAKENNRSPPLAPGITYSREASEHRLCLPLASNRISQEPQWADSSTMTNSQCTQDIPQLLSHGKLVSKNTNVHPPSSSTNWKMENSRLNDLVNTSKLSINLDKNKAHDSPGIVMDKKELLDVIQGNTSFIEVIEGDSKSTQALPAIAIPSNKSLQAPESRADLMLVVDTHACVTPAADQDNTSSRITVSGSPLDRTETNQGYENNASASMDQREEHHLDNSEGTHLEAMNTILAQPSDINQLDQTSHKRKRSKKIHGTVMYPVLEQDSMQPFDKYLCSNTFYLKVYVNNLEESSDYDVQDNLEDVAKNSVQRHSPVQTLKEIEQVNSSASIPAVLQNFTHMNGFAHVASVSSKQNQNKLYTNPVISDQFRNRLVQHLTSPSDVSDLSEIMTKDRGTTGLSVASSSQERNILCNHKPKDFSISSAFRNALLKRIQRNN